MNKEDTIEGVLFGINKNHTVLYKTTEKKDNRPLYKCKCGLCGNEEWFLKRKDIINGKYEHCGCGNKLEGKTFGFKNNHKIIKETEKRDVTGSKIFLCVCGECNKEFKITSRRIKHNNAISCGCLDNKRIAGINKERIYDTVERTPEELKFYGIYRKVKSRTSGKIDDSIKSYVEKGIKLCEEWKTFKGFKVDMWESFLEKLNKYSLSEISIDRIDPNGDYTKENCRWANYVTQALNRDFTKHPKNNPILCIRGSDEYKIITYNAKQFSRRIFGTPNCHIVDVCKGKRPQEKGWNFSYISDEEYYSLKNSGLDFIETVENFKLSIPYHEIVIDETTNIHDKKDEYFESLRCYFINYDNKIEYGLHSEVYEKLGFSTIKAFKSNLSKTKDKVRKLTPEEIELHKNNQPIKF